MRKIISDNYLEKFYNYRKDYFKYTHLIIGKEELVKSHKESVDDIIKNVKEYNFDGFSEEEIKKHLDEKFILISNKVDELLTELKPLYEKITNIKSESDNLYQAVLEKYPGIDINDMKLQIINYIGKFENDINDYKNFETF
jgi:hypothetical protein